MASSHLIDVAFRAVARISAGKLNDLHRFDLARLKWEPLATVGAPAPAPRLYFGLAAVGGRLYVFGGLGDAGEDAGLAGGGERKRGFREGGGRSRKGRWRA